ncbi:MAG: zinc-binding dehydrogenase [Actinobacteria bacterium]|nr:MAG: zinc-binding dehydrogenase [Actinomycetota bacterium]
MRAVVFTDGGRVEVTDVAAPVIERPTDAIVRVTRTAICGSDLHFLHGKAPIEPGSVLGHEAVGIVESIGEDVTRVRPGDRVVVSFHIACGSCWFCRRGETALCEKHAILGAGPFGGDLPGAQAERVRVPFAETNLLSIPDTMDDERALFVGDVLTTGVYAATLAEVMPEMTSAVVGLGPVGYCTVQALFALGARTVFGVDVDPARRAVAEASGAIAVDAARVNPQMVLARATQDRGADVVIEAVGTPAAYETSVDIVRRGGRVVVVGMYAGEVTELQLGVYWARALDVRFAGLCPTHAYWERTMALLADGRLDPSPIVSHRLSLEEAAVGYELFDRRVATKVLLAP